MGIRKHLKDKFLIFDGAMGTMLQSRGLKIGELPEVVNLTAPEKVIEIHKKFIAAGSQVLTTNTFGANGLKLKGSGHSPAEIIAAAVSNAKAAAAEKNIYTALDIGPLGELLKPMGTLSFQDAYDLFKTQVLLGVQNEVDLILIETMTDLYEAKAAILAAKENSKLPVFCTLSFEANQRTFTGCTIASMVMVLQGLGVDALGVNCSLGPKEIVPILDELLSTTHIPVMVQPNAGLPRLVGGKTIFDISPAEFGAYAKLFAEKGATILGGCCGTTEKHITALVEALRPLDVQSRRCRRVAGVCTPTNPVLLDNIKVIGERINPTGKKALKEALVKKDLNYIVREAISQVEAGADILDINVGLPEIDEGEMMVSVIEEVQSVLAVPLQIDSTDPSVIERGLRVYNGKAIVNSVNGKEASLNSILPLVKKYGAAVIGLTLDEKGIPPTAAGRFEIAKKIVRRAEEYKIPKEDIFIDCLTLTAAAQQAEAQETLGAVELVKRKLNVKTVLGISNISFGLPNRDLLNETFLAASLYAGLDLPIIDPLKTGMTDIIAAFKVLSNQDPGAQRYIDYCQKSIPSDTGSEGGDLFHIILKGNKEAAADATLQLLADLQPMSIIDNYIVPSLDVVGKQYDQGIIFLPQLIRSAETVKISFAVIKEALRRKSEALPAKGKVILATVKGDIHDIGKNIVKVLLENYNYDIIDLGRDVCKETIVETAVKEKVKLIGLSALMTTTVASMAETIELVKRTDPTIKIMVGGAVLNPEYAGLIKADFYAKDANEGVAIANKVLG